MSCSVSTSQIGSLVADFFEEPAEKDHAAEAYVQEHPHGPVSLSIDSLKLLRGVHTLLGHVRQQLPQEFGPVDDLGQTILLRPVFQLVRELPLWSGPSAMVTRALFWSTAPARSRHCMAEGPIRSSEVSALRVDPTAAPASLKAAADSKM